MQSLFTSDEAVLFLTFQEQYTVPKHTPVFIHDQMKKSPTSCIVLKLHHWLETSTREGKSTAYVYRPDIWRTTSSAIPWDIPWDQVASSTPGSLGQRGPNFDSDDEAVSPLMHLVVLDDGHCAICMLKAVCACNVGTASTVCVHV